MILYGLILTEAPKIPMLLTLAWRNIWRNPRRSYLIIGSLVFAIILSLLMQALQEGTYQSILHHSTKNYLGHLQIYPPVASQKYPSNKTLGTLDALQKMAQSSFREDLLVPRWTGQTIIQHNQKTQNAYLWGIEPVKEALFSHPSQYLISGNYFKNSTEKSILLGQALAKKLHVNTGDSLQLLIQNPLGKTTAQAFLVVGVVKLPNESLNKKLIYIPLKTLQTAQQTPNEVSYWAILLKNPQEIAQKIKKLKAAISPQLASIKTWKESQPELSQVIQSQQWGAGLMLGVLYIVIALGLWMSMVLLTHERKEELQVLISIGMTRLELGFSLALEMILLGTLGLLLGNLLAIPLLFYLMHHPILLSGAISESIQNLGLRPSLDYYFEVSSFLLPNLRLFVCVFLVSLYPVYKLFYLQSKDTSFRLWSWAGMGLIPSLAWKNLSRNPTRSLMIVLSIAFGLGMGAFMWAFANGLQTQRLQYQLNHSLGHLKINAKDFDDEKPLHAFFPLNQALQQKLADFKEDITAFSPRLNTYGMASNAQNNAEVDVYGIHPSSEKMVFKMYQNIIQGSYFTDSSAHQPMLIGQLLAKKLEIQLGQKILLHLPHFKNEVRQDTFQITGIYAMHNQNFEKTHVFIQAKDFQNYTGLQASDYHQIILKTPHQKQALFFSKKLKRLLPSYQVKNWAEIAPEFAYLDEVLGQFFTVFTGIILLALSFALMNMMLMAVLERQQEWAMLMAVGTQKKQLFMLIGLETMFLSVLGLCLGLLGAWVGIALGHSFGINLLWFDAQFAEMGIETKIYPFLKWQEYMTILILLLITALLSAWYPAWLALKTNTAKALQKK